ncbi:unnamed protein product [Acanthoscelides obtectus]|uniref:PiggyBac transposable element-derived protein domain-containing protein n=1 Tax=Acanthoscelides obtectus TaxID=200917 RepID=A0A9P0KNC3_ACAOB|nr:unnamed protein product [Acanthoscelides obtectus]CAK1682111.1 PiggyBac transposable element-derived protein 3 [Acanthoscelides obtectus]
MASNYEWTRPLTTSELLEEIENIENSEDLPDGIIITPPDDFSDNTDCDSGDEDSNDPDHLNSNQLSAQAEYYFMDTERRSQNETVIEGVAGIEWDEEDNLPLAYFASHFEYEKYKWMKGDLQSNNTETFSNFPPPLTLTSESSPLQFLQLFLAPDILTDLVKHSVAYASKKNKLNFELCLDEMYVFVGILVLSGYVPLPRRRMYWEESEDVHNELVSKSMRRNRFEEISSVFHAADNDNLPEGDKLGKIRPFIEAINKNFIKRSDDSILR